MGERNDVLFMASESLKARQASKAVTVSLSFSLSQTPLFSHQQRRPSRLHSPSHVLTDHPNPTMTTAPNGLVHASDNNTSSASPRQFGILHLIRSAP